MDLQFVSRTAFRAKDALISSLSNEFYVIPEGGSSHLALKGVQEMVNEIYEEVYPNYLCSAVGTGGTLAGILAGLRPQTNALGIMALKGATEGIRQDILALTNQQNSSNLILNDTFHFGGYAKKTPELIRFIKDFEQQFPDIQLEQVYTGKLLYGIFQLINDDFFPKGSTVVCLHTGGLQGRCTELA